MDTLSTAQQLDHAHHFQMYNRFPVTFSRGEGCTLYDTEGKAYLDALAGIAVTTVGHSHPTLVKAIQEQAAKLMHVSNLYYTEPQAQLAQRLSEVSGMDRVFFCNSGAEANEGAIKIARKIGHSLGRKGEVISMEGSFHGRTIGTIALGQAKYQEGFGPMPGATHQVPFLDLEALKAAIGPDTVAITLEPIQGEGGIWPGTTEYLQGVRALCDEHQLTLIFDEVQCGVGRTGAWYAWQHFGVKPDLIASAKALGGGFPIGAVLATETVAAHLGPGNHGTTYGGNPLACAAALAVLRIIEDEGLLQATTEQGAYLQAQLQELQTRFPDDITEVRGVGLMWGAQMAYPCRPLAERMLHNGLLVSATAGTVIRMVPPLTISRPQIDQLIDIFEKSLLEEKAK